MRSEPPPTSTPLYTQSYAMARAFAQAIEAGRAGFLAGPMEARDMAAPSTPVLGRANLS